MANIKSQKKRIRTNEAARMRNKAVKSELKTLTKHVQSAVDQGDAEKAQAALTLTREGETLTAGQGEVLFTEYGVSGPAMFDLSRQAAAGEDGQTQKLDILPG